MNSNYKIGDKVKFLNQECFVVAITFTQSKVYYDLKCYLHKNLYTTFDNIDSVMINREI